MHGGIAGKPLKTDGALVRLQAQVDVLMVFEVGFGGESFAALLANVRPLVVACVFLVHMAFHTSLGANPPAFFTLDIVMSHVHVKLQNFGKSDCSLSWRDYLNLSHPDSIWVPDDVVTAWLSAGDPVSPMVIVDMDLEEAFGKVFGTVWTHNPFLRPFNPPFFQGTRQA